MSPAAAGFSALRLPVAGGSRGPALRDPRGRAHRGSFSDDVTGRPTEARSRLYQRRSLQVSKQSFSRSRLYQRRSLQVNSHFSAFSKIYKIFIILRRSSLKTFENFVKNFVILNFSRKFTNFCKFSNISKILTNFRKFQINLKFLRKFEFRAVQKYANLVDLENC